jgi:hypothetical protein
VRLPRKRTQIDDSGHGEKGRRSDWSLDAQCAGHRHGPKPAGRRCKAEHRACRSAEHRWKLCGVDGGRELRRDAREDCRWKKSGQLTEQIRRLRAGGAPIFVVEQTRDCDRGAQPRGRYERTEE